MPEPSEPAPGSRRRMSRRVQVLSASVAVVLIGAIVVLVWPRGGTAEAADTGAGISVTHSGCGAGWTSPHGGTQTLTLTNTDSVAGDADLVGVGGAANGKVFGEVEGMGAGTTDTMLVTLGPGGYALRCVMEDLDPVTGPTVRIGGTGSSNAGVQPVTSTDLLGPLHQYQTYVDAGVADLVTRTDALNSAVTSGNVAQAKAAWLTAHLAYETLGAAYGAFGDYDGEINGTAAGLPGGVADAGFTGFHRVEYGLWHGEAQASLAAAAAQLDGYVHGLQHDLPQLQPQPNDLGLRAHEILENTLQFELTGQTDYGSGSNLATAQANLAGDREVVSVLRPLLASRFPGLSDVDNWSARFGALLDGLRQPDGSWPPISQVPQQTREKLNGTLGQLVEDLSPIATITEPRRTPQ